MPNTYDPTKMQMMGYLNAPPDIQAGASEIFRQQQLADLLRKQAVEPIKADEYTKSGSGQWAAPPQIVPVGIGQGLAKMGTALVGGYMDKKASEDSLALANKLRDRRQGVIDQVSSAMTGTPYKQGGTPDAIGDQPAGAVYTDDYTPVPAADQQGYKTLGTPATLPADRKQIASLLMNSGFPDLEKMGEQQLFAKPDKIEFIHGKPGEVIQQVQPDGSLKEVMRVPEKTQFESMSNEEKLVRSTLLAKGIKEGTPEWNAAAAPLFNKLMDKRTHITVNSGVSGGTEPTPEEVDFYAKMQSAGDSSWRIGLSRSKDGAALIRAVDKRMPSLGLTPDEVIANKQEVGTRQKILKDFSTGQQGKAVTAFNTAIDHLDTIKALGNALNNGDIQLANKIKNTAAAWTGNADVTNLDAAKQIVGQEVVKAIVANGGGQAEREEAANHISRISSPAQLSGYIETTQKLMGGQLRSLELQYEGSKRKDFREKLLPRSKAVLESLEQKPAASPSAGGLTPKEQAELDALRKRFGK